MQLFDQAAQSYQELLQSTNSNAADITVQEGESRTPPPRRSRRAQLDAGTDGVCFVPRSLDVAGLYHRGSDRWTGVIC